MMIFKTRIPLAMFHLDIPIDEKCLLVAIISFGRNKYFPSLRTLGKALNWSHAKVKYILERLLAKKLIKIKFGFWSIRVEDRRSNEYFFNFNEIIKYLTKKGKAIYYQGKSFLHNKNVLFNYRINNNKEIIQEQRIFISEDNQITFFIKKRRRNKIRDELIKVFGYSKVKDAISYVVTKGFFWKNPWVYLKNNLDIFKISEGFNDSMLKKDKFIPKDNFRPLDLHPSKSQMIELERQITLRQKEEAKKNAERNQVYSSILGPLIDLLKPKAIGHQENKKEMVKSRSISYRTKKLGCYFR